MRITPPKNNPYLFGKSYRIYSGRFEKKKDPSQPFTHQLLHPFVIGLPCIIAALFRLKMGESLAIF